VSSLSLVFVTRRIPRAPYLTRPGAHDTERRLQGVALDDFDALGEAAAFAFLNARPLRDNGFKVELGTRAIVDAVRQAGGET
jgi:hypothetical protein